MSDISERLRNLTPEQQKLLKLRLKQKGIKFSEGSGKSQSAGPAPRVRDGKQRNIAFSLFYFSADGKGEGSAKYRLLMDTIKFGDENKFSAVWTPERHFQAFGGLYPNPSVLSAAIAMITKNVQIRAGSVVLPLHSPVRVAEEWGVVDNLSDGRVGISFATGWHNHDYVIKPENFEDRREVMFRDIETVRRLWRGETLQIPGVGGEPSPVRTLPRPVQKELPYWCTASSDRTWRRAGEIGANVLSIIAGSLDDLERNIKIYRQARIQNGHDPRKGIVSIMLHTFLDHDLELTREKTREPLSHYLKNFLHQFSQLPGAEQYKDTDSLLDFAFERYFNHSSLLGTPEKCAAMVDALYDIGVNDLACLTDFGMDYDEVMKSLVLLAELQAQYAADPVDAD